MDSNRVASFDSLGGRESTCNSRLQELEQLLSIFKSLLLPLLEESATQNDDQDYSQNRNDFVAANSLGYVGSPKSLFNSFKTEFSSSGGRVDAIEAQMKNILSHSINGNSRGFLDKLYSSPSPPGIAAEMLLSMINSNGHVWHVSPALSTIEKRTAFALARQFGLDGDEAGGVTMPGGAASNTTALLIARNIVLPATKIHGSGHQHGSIFVSEAAHYSIANAAQMIGLGTQSVYRIATTPDGSMEPSQLRKAVQKSRNSGQTPVCIIATAGTTVKGAFDPLREISQISREENTWFHVDACWGGAAIFSQKLKSRLEGINMADSISSNPHKMLGVPLVCSFLLAADLRTFWVANKLKADYLFHNHKEEAANQHILDGGSEAGEGEMPHELMTESFDNSDWRRSPAVLNAPHAADIIDLASLTAQCGRRPDAVKMYLHWNYYGTKGMAASVDCAVASAQYLTGLVAKDPNLRLVGGSSMRFAQVCFYIEPAKDDQGVFIRSKEAEMNTKRTRAMSVALRKHGWLADFAPGNEQHEELGDFMRVVCHRETVKSVVDELFKAISSEAEKIRNIF